MCDRDYGMEGGPFKTCVDGDWVGEMRCHRELHFPFVAHKVFKYVLSKQTASGGTWNQFEKFIKSEKLVKCDAEKLFSLTQTVAQNCLKCGAFKIIPEHTTM